MAKWTKVKLGKRVKVTFSGKRVVGVFTKRGWHDSKSNIGKRAMKKGGTVVTLKGKKYYRPKR